MFAIVAPAKKHLAASRTPREAAPPTGTQQSGNPRLRPTSPARRIRTTCRRPRHTRGTPTNFIIRWLVTAIAVGVAVWLVPGIDIVGGTSAWVGIALFALVLSLVNISIKPIMQALSLPVTILTLGIFYLVVNTLMLYIAAWLANGIFQVGFAIATFGSAFVASIVISIVSGIVNSLVGKD